IDIPIKPLKELTLPRWVLGRLIVARSKHRDFPEYHERFNHPRYEPLCRCGKEKSSTHFYVCNILRKKWDRWKGPGKLRLPLMSTKERVRWMLTTPKGAIVYQIYLEYTRFFQEVSPFYY